MFLTFVEETGGSIEFKVKSGEKMTKKNIKKAKISTFERITPLWIFDYLFKVIRRVYIIVYHNFNLICF